MIDANIFVSAILSSENTCQEVLDLVAEGRIDLCYSQDIMEELKIVFSRPKFKAYSASIKLLQTAGTKVRTMEVINDCRDADDNKFLECALAGNADHIITGDKDLLVLDPWRNIKIISPKEFLARYKK